MMCILVTSELAELTRLETLLPADDPAFRPRPRQTLWPGAGAGGGDVRHSPRRAGLAGRAQRRGQDDAAADRRRAAKRPIAAASSCTPRPGWATWSSSPSSSRAARCGTRPRAALADDRRPGHEARKRSPHAMAAETDEAERKRLEHRFEHLQHELQHHDAYNLDHHIERVLDGLGFAKASFQQAGRAAQRRAAEPAAAGQAAAGRAGPDAARRAVEPPRHRRHRVAGRLPGRVASRRCSSSATTATSSTT